MKQKSRDQKVRRYVARRGILMFKESNSLYLFFDAESYNFIAKATSIEEAEKFAFNETNEQSERR